MGNKKIIEDMVTRAKLAKLRPVVTESNRAQVEVALNKMLEISARIIQKLK